MADELSIAEPAAADTIHNNLYTALSRMTLLDKIGWINNSKYVVYISVVVYTIQSLSYLPQQALEMRYADVHTANRR